MFCPYLYSCLQGNEPMFNCFARVEVHPVEVRYQGTSVEYLGMCKRAVPNPVLWTVYGHYYNGEIIAITDRPCRESAYRIASYFERRFGVPLVADADTFH